MNGLIHLTAACLLALPSCGEPERKDDMAADAKHWEPGIYSATKKDDGVVLRVVLLDKKKIQVYAGVRQLAGFWTSADVPTDIFIAVRGGVMILGDGEITSADPLGLGAVVFADNLPSLKDGVHDLVLGTMNGQVPFGVRLIPIIQNVGIEEASHVKTMEKSAQISEAASNPWQHATGQEIVWSGVAVTMPEPWILPAAMKEKMRNRMSPREIVTTFGKGWMSKDSGGGSIKWLFEDGSMTHIQYRPGTMTVDQAVDVYLHDPLEKQRSIEPKR